VPDEGEGERMNLLPPGLTCAECSQPFDRTLASRTPAGFVHAEPCPESPRALNGGRWVMRGGISRWVPNDFSDQRRRDLHAAYARGERTPEAIAGEREYQRTRDRKKAAA
jgi:hypothetical protein